MLYSKSLQQLIMYPRVTDKGTQSWGVRQLSQAHAAESGGNGILIQIILTLEPILFFMMPWCPSFPQTVAAQQGQYTTPVQTRQSRTGYMAVMSRTFSLGHFFPFFPQIRQQICCLTGLGSWRPPLSPFSHEPDKSQLIWFLYNYKMMFQKLKCTLQAWIMSEHYYAVFFYALKDEYLRPWP